MQQNIVPNLWFDKEAKEAADFYASVFPGSKVTGVTVLKDTPSGDCDLVRFTLAGHEFMAISAGPYFKLNPAISFMVHFDSAKDDKAKEHLSEVWEKLMDGGEALMPLQEYPFSKWYGWAKDRFGVTWQLMMTDLTSEERPCIVPSLMFVQENAGKAEEATEFYLSIFKNAPGEHATDTKRGTLARYPAGMEPDKEGSVMYTDFMLDGEWFVAMDSAHDHKFNFTEAISLMVKCDSQEEIDYFWEKLSAVSESEQCGWLKDTYGVSWQIVPREQDQMMNEGTDEQVYRLSQATLKMKKLDMALLRAAFEGK